MTRRVRFSAPVLAPLLALFALLATPASACRLALLLALDVSGSVDAQEYRLQREGLAAALLSPQVRESLLSQPENPVALAIFEWAHPSEQTLLLDWTPITSHATLLQATASLNAPEAKRGQGTTALGAALLHAGRMFARAPPCLAHTLDISGDGKANESPHPADIRDAPILAGVTINALVIGVDDAHGGDHRQLQIGELSSYFRAHVIKGHHSFVQTALGYSDYERAMTRKLLRELQTMVFGSLR